MDKNILNKYLKHFGAEVHGIGYMQKLRKGGAPKDAMARQREMLGSKVQTIVDAGANIGHTAEHLLKTFPAAQVHAFEPFADSFAQMQHRIGSNPRAKLQAVGLAATPGTAKLHVNKSAATNSLLTTTSLGVSSDDACATIGEVDITLTTLDSYAAGNNLKTIDILKMDVQGYELEVLKGAAQLLENGGIGMIYTECYFQPQYEQQPLYHDMAAFLYARGFVLEDWYNPYYSKNTLLWCDALFVHLPTLNK